MINIHPYSCKYLGTVVEKAERFVFVFLFRVKGVPPDWCAIKKKLKRFCWRQAYLVLCLCTKWLIGLWINMICFQGFDSEYPDYANLPPLRGRGKLKKWQSFSLVWLHCELFSCVWPTLLRNSPHFCHTLDKSHSIIRLTRWTFSRENTHPHIIHLLSTLSVAASRSNLSPETSVV